jgi:hypothetical protein
MTIDQNGNVGVGTSTPARKLDVNGVISGTDVLVGANSAITTLTAGTGIVITGNGNSRTISSTVSSTDCVVVPNSLKCPDSALNNASYWTTSIGAEGSEDCYGSIYNPNYYCNAQSTPNWFPGINPGTGIISPYCVSRQSPVKTVHCNNVAYSTWYKPLTWSQKLCCK